ncbi:putative histone-lysine N-methyltransferase Mes-4 [Lucilia cuprina]|nr:putative histone-lysine N-methyltransferase Mes-4 [Lucilia cuprina]
METLGSGTENPIENFTRSSRRVRNNNNNKSITSKLNDSKDQENVNNTSAVQSEAADTSIKEDLTKSNATIDAKVHNTTANINSSTPRRKKDPLANLHSNLSPKYIGFTTPPQQLNSSKEERTRSLRRRHNNSTNNADSSLDKETADMTFSTTFTPNNESTVGFVRRTPRNKDSQSTPDSSSAKRKDFVSPIDKLLIKNGAVMENNNNLPLKEYNELNSKGKELIKDEQNKVQEMETELGVKKLENCDDTIDLDSVKECETNGTISDGNCEEAIKDKDENEDSISVSSVIAKQLEDDDEEEIESKEDEPIQEKENNTENEADTSQHQLNEEEYEEQQSKLEEAKDERQSEVGIENDYFENKSNASLQNNEIEMETNENEAEDKDSDKNDDKTSLEENSGEQMETSKSISPLNESVIESPETGEQNEKSQVKIELESVETESNNEFVVEATASANSPSAVSMDSAKGSSIINEGSWMSFSTGDLYWGQIYNYCYWPCMVCPDPEGKTITTEEVGRSGDQTVLVHVRFFADNGRRNWVKRENLMPFNGIESYQERIDEVREKYGPKSAKYKLYVPTKRKEPVWYDAVNEANLVNEVAYAERLEKFYEIFEKSKAFHKLEKQRRKSMYISVNTTNNSDIESFYGSNDNINSLSVPAVAKQKRERSISPYSPAYSPIKPVASKRRKLSEEQELVPATTTSSLVVKTEENSTNTGDLNLSQTNSVASTSSNSNSLNDLEIFSGLEFRKFYAVMKDFVMEQNHNEKLEKSLVVAVRNIWALKQLSRRQMERKLRVSLTETDMSTSLAVANDRPATGDGSVKRLSSRLKTLMVRKSLMAQQTPEGTPERSETPKPATKDTPTVKKPLNRPILEVIDDIFELDSKYLFKGMSRDPVCKYCFRPGGNLRRCAKNCSYWLHNECLYKDFSQGGKRRGPKALNGAKPHNDTLNGSHSSSVTSLTEIGTVAHVTGDSEAPVAEVICKECSNNEPTKCMVCQSTESKKADDPLVKCCMTQCDRAFHPACCKYWPQAKITISKNHIESFRCPSHVCQTCVSDDPKGKFQHLSNAKLTKCVKCPATFHTDSTCIPAGSQILTAAHIICPRHSSSKHDMTVNVNWCFICVGGGQVICCETCPTAVHAHCLKIPIDPNEGYICEECESGRMPLYGEMVWAKFNNFRWWPAIILPPTEIPKNIARKTHNPSDFVVRFFGTHDHGWISRRRVYLYLEGDSSEPPKTKSSLDLSYNKGVEEAKEVYEIIKAKKLQQRNANENKEKLHPQPYVRIKANRAVPPVKLHIDIESVSKCECDPREENPCGPDTNCLNRVLYHECNPKICPAGERCQNQMFESRISPRLDVVYMKERGFGLICREPIKAGTFIIEYVGEIINDDEFQARMQQKSRDRDENFYFLSVEKDYIIDAGPKGNLARFMNHSCDPNCETQKWSVNSLNRVGLFAIKDIPENTELTFNYHWDDLLGNEKKTCFCGAKKCAGQIGAKIKDIETVKEPIVTSGSCKNKSKTKTKPLKRLLNGGLKNKLGTKLKINTKTKTKSKKMSAAATVAALLQVKTENTNPTTINVDLTEDRETTEEASTSRRLESPDIFC